MSTFGQRLRSTRERRVLTQEDLAATSQVRVVTISRLENDRVAGPPRQSTVRKLAGALGVDPVWLLFGDGESAAVGRIG